MTRMPRLALLAPAAVLAAALAGLVPLLVFAAAQGGQFALDAYVWRILGFTLLQAGLSTVLSLASCHCRRPCAGLPAVSGPRILLLALFAVPQALPAIVVVLALVELYGSPDGLVGSSASMG
jgi:thiamine transport system permease protein